MGKEELFLNSILSPRPIPEGAQVFLGDNQEYPLVISGGITASVVSFDMITFGACAPGNIVQIEAELFKRVFASWGAVITHLPDQPTLTLIKYQEMIKVYCGFQDGCFTGGKALSKPVQDTLGSLMLMPKGIITRVTQSGLGIGKVRNISFKAFPGLETIAFPGKVIKDLGVTIPKLRGVELEDTVLYPVTLPEITWRIAQQERFHPYAAILKQTSLPTNSHPVRPNQDHSWRNK